jgi:hypothetical protein
MPDNFWLFAKRDGVAGTGGLVAERVENSSVTTETPCCFLYISLSGTGGTGGTGILRSFRSEPRDFSQKVFESARATSSTRSTAKKPAKSKPEQVKSGTGAPSGSPVPAQNVAF